MTIDFDSLRPFISRFLGIAVGGLVTWLTVHYGLNLDEASRHDLVDTFVKLIVEFMAVYIATHRIADKKFNPADTAGSHLAAEGRRESTRIKKNAKAAKRARG